MVDSALCHMPALTRLYSFKRMSHRAGNDPDAPLVCTPSAHRAGPAPGYARVRAAVAGVLPVISSQTARTRGKGCNGYDNGTPARKACPDARDRRDSCEQRDLVSANRAVTILVRTVHSRCDFRTSCLLSRESWYSSPCRVIRHCASGGVGLRHPAAKDCPTSRAQHSRMVFAVTGFCLDESEVRTHARADEPVSILLVISATRFTHLLRRAILSEGVRTKHAAGDSLRKV